MHNYVICLSFLCLSQVSEYLSCMHNITYMHMHMYVHDKDQDTRERQSKATQTKSQGSSFSKKIAALGGNRTHTTFSVLGWVLYIPLSYQGSSAGWVQITHTNATQSKASISTWWTGEIMKEKARVIKPSKMPISKLSNVHDKKQDKAKRKSSPFSKKNCCDMQAPAAWSLMSLLTVLWMSSSSTSHPAPCTNTLTLSTTSPLTVTSVWRHRDDWNGPTISRLNSSRGTECRDSVTRLANGSTWKYTQRPL